MKKHNKECGTFYGLFMSHNKGGAIYVLRPCYKGVLKYERMK